MGTAFTFFLWYGSDVESFPQAYSESCGSMSSVTSRFCKTFSEIRSNLWLTAMLFPFHLEASKQVESFQPRWWFSGLHCLCHCIADTTEFCKLMDGFWNRLHKLSCCWSSEWGLSWQCWWLLQHWLQEQESCMTNSREMYDLIVTVLSEDT